MPSVISFDLDGTLCSLALNNRIYRQLIPKLYAERNGLDYLEAVEYTIKEYERTSPSSVNYYNFDKWLRYFKLSDKKEYILSEARGYVHIYKDTLYALDKLKKSFDLVITSMSSREIMQLSLDILPNVFTKSYSLLTDFNTIKSVKSYELICNDLGKKPNEIIHIGDSYKLDYVIPKKVGIRSYYLDRSGVTIKNKDVVYDLIEFADLLM